jgi:hypothetical protein
MKILRTLSKSLGEYNNMENKGVDFLVRLEDDETIEGVAVTPCHTISFSETPYKYTV